MEHLFGLASESRCLINRRYKRFVTTLHCALEKGADLYVNKRQKIQDTIMLGLLKKEEEEERIMQNCDFLLRVVRT